MITNHRIRRFLQHGRIGIGVIALVFPGLICRLLGVERAAGSRLLTRLFGAREVAIGGGQLAAEQTGGDDLWFKIGAATDLCDGLVLLAAAASGKTPRLRALVFAKLAFLSAIGSLIVASETSSEE